MSRRDICVVIRTGVDSDEQERVRGTQQLRRLLLQSGVEGARLLRNGETSDGAKAGDAVVVGALIVSLAPAVLTSVVAMIQSWSARAAGRTVEIVEDGRSLLVSGLSEEQQRELIADFRRRWSAAADEETSDGRAPT
ncbi:hypothetical protein [Streptomyces spectabilis]|uniref:Uncharacterized protein n=1 Tax=Streptomyces spectabilis TaxID=68270 RepID=A0A5P2XNM1_STRST|nr:hypothetical protein [Streptomyces spectabilis]MBB5102394.1 hypothetical protein [Streptomyces spectabilis]MCI3907437.1 hypothetical protein [Streptomyces spectabilis]QEV64146.1 hypothetical protein CP982_40170 [Streptomyces spectabilis]GGV32095.1 hypothetical protein GCM10010245_52120 [Streptomyces spectabilis]